jgi:histidine triad (HIT) family protein
MSDCIFCKIIAGEIPCKKVYEDDEILAFHDIHPLRPVHFLMIPKHHVASLDACQNSDAPILGKMLTLAPKLAADAGSPDGFRVIINTGRVGNQEVPHVHIHIVGGPESVGPMLKRL